MLVPVINARFNPRYKGLQGLDFVSRGRSVPDGAILEESTVDCLLHLG